MLRKLPDVRYTPGVPGTPDVTTCTEPPAPPPAPPPSSPEPPPAGICTLGYGYLPYCRASLYDPTVYGTQPLPPGFYVIPQTLYGHTIYNLCIDVYTCLDFGFSWYPDP